MCKHKITRLCTGTPVCARRCCGPSSFKINIEEEVIQRGDAIREEYRPYMRKTTKIGKASAYARSKSGPVRPDSMPTRLSILITPFQGFVQFLVPTVYMISVIAAGTNRPRWMHALALPDT
ncbi:hypothetical protein EV363DRAFT_1190881 [Boletus edulis]|uniref:Uncharacterized protein n=1 Tax=Boletus edulis BED1 TaxID=1328754 RepID=A0AAD4BA30_BOLED|nr:hypothetical protein EV363DRAFT_1190881 [Boletus edulis]KAF8414491.1 hypothetical protein L210DRAFT_976906 [Boletus edulis BED1]